MIVFQILVQGTDHCAVQHTDFTFIQSSGIRGNVAIYIVLNQVIGFFTHYSIRIADYFGTVFSPRQTGKQINLAIEKHLIKITKLPIDIFIFPASIFRKLSIVFIGIAVLNLTFFSSLLKNFVLVITYSNYFRLLISICINRVTNNKEHYREDEENKSM